MSIQIKDEGFGTVLLEKGDAGAFMSANLVYNAILKEFMGFQLREEYG